MFSAIEKIEVAFRTQIVYQVSNELQNPFWLDDVNNFKNAASYNRTYTDLKKIVSASNDLFIKHFLSTYSNPMPPAWMVAEVMQMGHISHLFENLKTTPAKQQIGTFFGVTHQVLETWMHTLVYVRNICAHHARFWNKTLRIKPMLPKKPMNKWIANSLAMPTDKFFTVFCIIKYLLDIIAPHNQFVEKFENLLAKYPNTKTSDMGFPANWKSEVLFS